MDRILAMALTDVRSRTGQGERAWLANRQVLYPTLQVEQLTFAISQLLRSQAKAVDSGNAPQVSYARHRTTQEASR